MDAASRLRDKAREYEQSAAHHAERAEAVAAGLIVRAGEKRAAYDEEKLAAINFTSVAIALREVAECFEDAA